MFNFFLGLFSQRDPFELHVNQVLTENRYSENEIIEKFYRKTKFEQRYVFVLVQRNGKFYVLLILDELHRNKVVVRLQRNTPEGYIIKNKSFGTETQARNYISQKIVAYRNGIFDGEAYYYRIVTCKPECRHHQAKMPDADGCFLPGDYLTRDLQGFRLASHAGIYCGRNKIAHFDSTDAAATIWSCLMGNGTHYVHLTEWQNFVINQGQEIRILVHCFQQSLKEDKVRAAVELAEKRYGEYEYGLLTNNCQHFASLISTGRCEMIERDVVEQGVLAVAVVGGLAALGYAAYRYMFPTPVAVAAEGNAIGGDAVEGNAIIAHAAERNAIQGNAVGGNAIEGNDAEGSAVGRNAIEGSAIKVQAVVTRNNEQDQRRQQ